MKTREKRNVAKSEGLLHPQYNTFSLYHQLMHLAEAERNPYNSNLFFRHTEELLHVDCSIESLVK